MIADHEIADESWGGAVEMSDLYARMTHVFSCPDCGRLWIFWRGFDGPPVAYAPEH